MVFQVSKNTLSVLTGVILLTACSTESGQQFATPVAFEAASYCEATNGEGEAIIPPELLAAMENEDGRASGGEIADALLQKAAIEIAHQADSKPACLEKFRLGEDLFSEVLNLQRRQLSRAGSYKPSQDSEIADVQKEITRLWREDQSGRGAYVALQTDDRSGSAFWAQRLATAHITRIDDESTRYIERLLDQYDWIDSHRFGKSVSAHAWILVQHADDRPDLQAEVLARMEAYLSDGGVSRKNYAYLWDRVAVNTGRKQRYGTQPTWECVDGNLELQPLEDPESVNERRAEMGLNTVEEGLAEMARSICG